MTTPTKKTSLGDGGPAFPIPDSHHANGGVQYGANGMTLRDYFAAKALAGMLADTECSSSASNLAQASYLIADAMLAERAKAWTGR